ncbi:gliding motility-associated-like protein [Pedobacter sp. AK013]|uniref:T9SS type B sorting domain-containing protein n=1 Tax=Pedobacter sp. AK013 TaxID=2723071 RepID=UPI0016070C19|nr:T9SS type B sorting domain-containing protein [Pedobacter sp. AK013]MBB6239444.1 gliding motility-associated-like protein [Pedobacter sp. AK013]
MHSLSKALFFLSILLFANFAKAQLCNGTFGQPLISQTFGQGNNTDSWYGPLAQYAPGATTYTTFVGPPGVSPRNLTANQSGLVKTPATPGNPLTIYWQPHADHTGDPNGLMLLIDGIATRTVFFEQRMDNLCPNTTLRLSIWVLNTNSPAANARNPNMILRITDPDNNILVEKPTEDVLPDGTWHQYFIDFTNGNSSTITLQLVNNTLTNSGNDFALDDITVQACGPAITPFFNTNASLLNMCEGNTSNFILDANITAGYTNAVYQWQENTGSGWADMVDKTTKQAAIDFLNRIPGTYQYRLITAMNGNINRTYCRAVSEPIKVTVNPLPTAIAENSGPVCIGSNIQLNASGGTSYSWTGPNQFSSTDKSPSIPNATKAMEGTYTVQVTANGCTFPATTTVEVLAPIIPITNIQSATICEGKSVQLEASGGSSYLWTPSNGLSNPQTSNPIASPTETTTYTVKVSNNNCFETAVITVNVNKNVVTDAGVDQTIVTGQSTILNGKVSGDDFTYFWTPSDYLDDPTKLNPTATPTKDITYTLHASSNLGCNSSNDEVFIKVYPKVVIPNSFTPNGDDVNDTWNIPSIASFPGSIVKVTNRYGQLVYQSNGTFKGWDGKMNGKDLPPAVYYYSIYLNKDFKTYTGWVMLMR